MQCTEEESEKKVKLNHEAIAKEHAMYDDSVKRLLSQKPVLCWILKYNVREFRGMEDKDIMKCIESDISVGETPVDPGETNNNIESISGMNTEDAVVGEGKITYDIKFYVRIPKKTDKMKMIINVEAQKNMHPGYFLESRAVFYAARLISAQKGPEFVKSNYDDIKKVYTIWLCMDATKQIGNTIAEYTINKQDILGNAPDNKSAYDKLSIIIVNLCPEEASGNWFTGVMNTCLGQSEKLTKAERIRRLQEVYHVEIDENLVKGVEDMCNLSDLIAERGREEGMEKGMEKGREEIVENMLKNGFKVEEITIATKMSKEKVLEIMNKSKVLV